MKPKLSRWGNSLAVRIPKRVAQAARLRSGDSVDVEAGGPGKLRIRATAFKPTLASLVRRITKKNRHTETDWGAPRGRELW